jgi:hypothetical protein
LRTKAASTANPGDVPAKTAARSIGPTGLLVPTGLASSKETRQHRTNYQNTAAN